MRFSRKHAVSLSQECSANFAHVVLRDCLSSGNKSHMISTLRSEEIPFQRFVFSLLLFYCSIFGSKVAMISCHSPMKSEQQMSSKHVNNIINGFYSLSTLEIMCDMQKTDMRSRRKSAPKLRADFLVGEYISFLSNHTKIDLTRPFGEPHVNFRAHKVHFD